MNKLLLQLTIIAQDSIFAEQNPLCQIQQFTERTADYNGTIIDPFVIDDTENLYCMQRIEPVVITDSYGDEELKTEEYLLADLSHTQ